MDAIRRRRSLRALGDVVLDQVRIKDPRRSHGVALLEAPGKERNEAFQAMRTPAGITWSALDFGQQVRQESAAKRLDVLVTDVLRIECSVDDESIQIVRGQRLEKYEGDTPECAPAWRDAGSPRGLPSHFQTQLT